MASDSRSLVTSPAERPQPHVSPTPVFVTGFVLTAYVHNILPAGLPEPELTTAAGIVLMVAGIAMFVWSLVIFTRARTGIMFHEPACRLIDIGPYAWSRNPQYVGFVAIYLGLALMLNSLWPLVALPFVTALVTRAVIMPEERYLLEKFGADYETYCTRVHRWL